MEGDTPSPSPRGPPSHAATMSEVKSPRNVTNKATNQQDRSRTFGALGGRKPKPVMSEDLDSLRDSLAADIANTKQECLAVLQVEKDKRRDEMQQLREQCCETLPAEAAKARQQLEVDCRNFTADCCVHLQEGIDRLQQNISEHVRLGFAAAKTEARDFAMQAEKAARRETVRTVAMMRAELAAATTVRWVQTTTLIKELSRQTEAQLSEVQAWVTVAAQDVIPPLERELVKLRSELEALNVDVNSKVREVENGLERTGKTVDHILHDMAHKTASLERKHEEHKDHSGGQFQDLRDETDRRLEAIETQARNLRTSVQEVENLPTRRVEWIVQGASVNLDLSASPSTSSPPIPTQGAPAASTLGSSGSSALSLAQDATVPHRSWASPVFEAAGAKGLYLELLQAEAPQLLSSEPEDYNIFQPKDRKPPAPPGSTALRLWSPEEGLNLLCRFYIGTASLQLQHTFDGSQPCCTQWFCNVKDHIAEDDTVRIGMEILEVVREVRNPTPPASMGGGGDLQGYMVSHRYLNFRMLDLVQNQVERMQSRMVRRIEWRVEQASALRRCFPEGESLCSTTFEAAGVEGLSIVFYPSGCVGVREGYCSLFLHCPAGSSLRCWLWAGKQRREARLDFDRPGFFGRTNFCRFESCADPALDSVLLVLEIEEAQQSVTENLTHQVSSVNTCSERRPQTAPGGPPEKVGAATPKPESIDSSVKLRRTPGRVALEDVRQLPSIWTPRVPTALAEALEGFHSFAELSKSTNSTSGGKKAPLIHPVSGRRLPPGSVDAALAQQRAAEAQARYAMYS